MVKFTLNYVTIQILLLLYPCGKYQGTAIQITV